MQGNSRTWTRTSSLSLTDRQASRFANFAKLFNGLCSKRKSRNNLRIREGNGVVKVKASQKIFTDTETANLTGICLEHLHGLARRRHLGFIARAAEVAGPRPDQWLVTRSGLVGLLIVHPPRGALAGGRRRPFCA